LSRFGDFLGLILIFFCCSVIPIILVIGCSYIALLSPNHVIDIDADCKMVTCDFDLPWMKPYSKSYNFNELFIKMITESENNRIDLYVPDRRFALTLISELDTYVLEQKFGRLEEIGLPSK